MEKLYPESGVEIQGFVAKHYDKVMNFLSFGLYNSFIKKAIKSMGISPADKILDLGAGTGRNALLMLEQLSENGGITGLEISDIMIKQFENNCKDYKNAEIINRRIDQPLEFKNEFDKVFISFVLHGFPNIIRKTIVKNAYNALKPGGEFIVLDFNEFIIKEMPFYARIPFKIIECQYAFDFVERDWKTIFQKSGFNDFKETIFMKKYVRLLKMKKIIK